MRTRALAIAGVAVAVGVVICGGGPASATGAGRTSARAGRILAAAEAAIDHVHSYQLHGTTTIAGQATSLSGSFRLPGSFSVVTRQPTGTVDLRAVAGTVYFRASRPYYKSVGVKGATLAVISGRWVSASAAQVPTAASLLAFSNPARAGRCLLAQRLGTLSVDGYASVAGRRAVVLRIAADRPGRLAGRLYISTGKPALPLRIVRSGTVSSARASSLCGTQSRSASSATATSDLFVTRVNAPVTITPPAGAISPSALRQRLAAAGGITAAPVLTAHTALGTVGYRTLGSGPPLVLITGYGGTMESWDPRFVGALAKRYRVVIFDNAGIGRTAALKRPLTIDAMADQTSALIDALGLRKPNVLGWSMGSMIAEDLAIRHPAQVRRLVLCAAFPGNGTVARPPQAVIDALTSGNEKAAMAALFPANQTKAAQAFFTAISRYPSSPTVSKATIAAQAHAVTAWWNGDDPAGRQAAKIAAPTLIADGSADRLDPTANSHALLATIPHSRLVLYPDAGHAFLFQDERAFVPLAESFLG